AYEISRDWSSDVCSSDLPIYRWIRQRFLYFASFWPLHPKHLQPFSPKRLLLKFVIHLKYCSWIPGVFFFGLIVCCNNGTSSDEKREGLQLVSVDISKSRSGKFSEFFEAEAEYIWLKDDSDDALLNAGLNKIIFHQNKIFTLGIFGCKCIHIFDKSGKYLARIFAYGEGPGKYLDFDGAAIVNQELVLLGVYPHKIMWFSLEGKFLREVPFRDRVGTGLYSVLQISTSPTQPSLSSIGSLNLPFPPTPGCWPGGRNPPSRVLFHPRPGAQCL